MKTQINKSPIQIPRGAAKALLIFFSITFLFVTSCDILSGSKNETKQDPNPMWPQTIEQEDKTVISALSTATFEDSINSMQTILNILDKYKDDPIVKPYVDVLNKVRNALVADDVKSLANPVNGEDVAKLSKLTKSVKQIEEKREITLDDTNKDLFPDKYNTADAKKKEYDNYKTGPYASAWREYEGAYNTYDGAYGTYEGAYGNEENPADDTYLKAYNTYKNSLGALPRTEYDKLVNFAKDVVEDFKDNYVFNGNYSEEQVRTLITNAQTEANNQKSDRDDALATYNSAKNEFVNGAESNFRTAQATYEGAESRFVNNEKATVEQKYNDAVAAKEAYDNAAQTVKNFTVGENIENADLTGIEKIQLSIPAGAESVDVFAFIETWQAIKDKIGDNSNVTLVANYNNMPFKMDFAAQETAGKSNTDLLNEYYTRYNEDKLTSADEGKTVETEIIPGVKIVTFMDWWHRGNPDVLNALKISYEASDSKKNVVKMPQNYSLGGEELNNSTYKSGIIGDVKFENLANTNISGTVYGKDSFSSVYDLFVKNQQDASELPNMNIKFSVINLDTSLLGWKNLYGYDIDTLITKYYNCDKGDKLVLDFTDNFDFDARDYLNGGSMYEGNNYKNNAYSLDINAALVMNSNTTYKTSIKNVKIEGTKKTTKNVLDLLTNVVCSVSMAGIRAGCCYGVVDFNYEAPESLSGGSNDSLVTFKNVSENIITGGLGYVDCSALSQEQAYRINPGSPYSVVRVLIKPGISLPGFTSGHTTDTLGVTKQEIEEMYYPHQSKVLPKDIKQSKMDLMRNILEDNQKQYS